MITCAQAVEQLWSFIDGSLEEDDRGRVDEHLSFCRRCCGEAEFVEELARTLAGDAPDAIQPDVRARMVALLEELTS